MSLSKYILFCIAVFLLSSCQSSKKSEPAHLRALTMIQYASASLTIQGQQKHKDVQKKLSLQYGKPTQYQTIPPGYYDITLHVNGKELLKGSYVLGKNGYYSMLALGLLPKEWMVNPRTTMFKLKNIFAGEEMTSTNKYLPQWFMMRDNYDGSQQSAYIRFVNANPVTATLSIKKGDKKLKSGLAYPTESGMLKLKSGSQNLRVLYGDVTLGEKNIQTKPGYIYTAVIGNKKKCNGALSIPVLENPSRSLLNAK